MSGVQSGKEGSKGLTGGTVPLFNFAGNKGNVVIEGNVTVNCITSSAVEGQIVFAAHVIGGPPPPIPVAVVPAPALDAPLDDTSTRPPSPCFPAHVCALTGEEVVSWLRSACKLNDDDCEALGRSGIDGSCLGEVEHRDLVTAGMRFVKARKVCKVIQEGPWPSV